MRSRKRGTNNEMLKCRKRSYNDNDLHIACKRVKRDDDDSWQRVRSTFDNCIIGNFPMDNEAYSVDCDGRSSLHTILEKDPPLDIINLFISYAKDSLKLKNRQGELPIHVACQNEVKIDVIKALIDAYPDGLREQDINGCLPIHDFCHYGICVEGVKLLQEAFPEGIQIVNNLGYLPIHYASLQNAPLEVLDFLLLSYPESMEKKSPYGNPSMLMKKKHRNWLQTKDEHGKIPLHHAFEGDFSKYLRRLIRDAYPNGIHDKDIHGKTPLDYKRKSWKFWDTNIVHKKNAEQLECFTTIPHEDSVIVTQAMQPRIVDEWNHHNNDIAKLELLVSALESEVAKMKEVYRRRYISMLALLLCILFCFLFFSCDPAKKYRKYYNT
jgi:hypothetical protein